jgi:hypothetical protein
MEDWKAFDFDAISKKIHLSGNTQTQQFYFVLTTRVRRLNRFSQNLWLFALKAGVTDPSIFGARGNSQL